MTIVLEREDAEVTALVALPAGMTALEVFSAANPESEEHPIFDILEKVRREIEAFEPDLTTPAGRKRIASMAHKVSLYKGELKRRGDEVAREQKEIPKRIDATRRHINETLDDLRDAVRKPLDEWEAAETRRIDDIKAGLAELEALISDTVERPAKVMRERLGELHHDTPTSGRFQEYLEAAADLHAKAVAALTARIAAAEKREAEAAELEALRKEKAERERIEREADEAAERAAREKRIAEQAAAAEREKAAAAAARAKADAEARERALVAEAEAARKAAEQAAIDAARRIREEAEAKALAERQAQEKRERDTKHKAAINRKALTALVDGGIPEDVAKKVITLIAKGEVPAISIAY